jgi:hypothetical protein
MLRRFCFYTAAFCILLGLAAPCAAQTDSPSGSTTSPPAQEVPRTLSPLHAFLGIDPVTGEFKPPNAASSAKVTRSMPGMSPGPLEPKSTAPSSEPERVEHSAGGSSLRDVLTQAAESGEMPAGNTVIGDTTVDELRAQITKAVGDQDDQALTAALAKVTGAVDSDEAFPGARYAQLATLAFLVYPLGIALTAIFAAWAGSRRHVRTDRDRRHDARQLRRRLTLALTTASTIGLVWLAGEHNFWWSEPRRLAAAIVATTVLMLVSAGLRMMIRRAASDYARKTIEDLRCQHAALCDEVKELRKRLQGEGLPETV